MIITGASICCRAAGDWEQKTTWRQSIRWFSSNRPQRPHERQGLSVQWNCSSSVEPVRAFTLEEPPWITVVTSSK